MKTASRVLEKISIKNNPNQKNVEEGRHHNTKVRATYEGVGSRKIRLTIKESVRMMDAFCDENIAGAYPKDTQSKQNMVDAKYLCERAMEKIKTVKDAKKKSKISEDIESADVAVRKFLNPKVEKMLVDIWGDKTGASKLANSFSAMLIALFEDDKTNELIRLIKKAEREFLKEVSKED